MTRSPSNAKNSPNFNRRGVRIVPFLPTNIRLRVRGFRPELSGPTGNTNHSLVDVFEDRDSTRRQIWPKCVSVQSLVPPIAFTVKCDFNHVCDVVNRGLCAASVPWRIACRCTSGGATDADEEPGSSRPKPAFTRRRRVKWRGWRTAIRKETVPRDWKTIEVMTKA
jgi:hypothetical protein